MDEIIKQSYYGQLWFAKKCAKENKTCEDIWNDIPKRCSIRRLEDMKLIEKNLNEQLFKEETAKLTKRDILREMRTKLTEHPTDSIEWKTLDFQIKYLEKNATRIRGLKTKIESHANKMKQIEDEISQLSTTPRASVPASFFKYGYFTKIWQGIISYLPNGVLPASDDLYAYIETSQ